MTSINDITPFEPVHPGSILGEELKARGISQKEFAKMIGLQATHLSALIHGARNITPAVAAKLEAGLGDISAEMWLRLQNQYNVDVQRKRLKPSLLVSGYSKKVMPAAVLAEPEVEPEVEPETETRPDSQVKHEDTIKVLVTVPIADRELLAAIAARFGWEIERVSAPGIIQ